jgi:HAMP domain-containing protein
MLATIISGVDATFITNMTAYIGDLFTDLNLLIVLVIGLPLAFWVIRKTISLVRAR